MKVLLATGIYPPEIGGPASFSCDLARELKRRGQEPTVICYGDEKTQTGDGWPVIVVRRSGGPLVRYARYAWNVYRAARKSDIVFLQGPVSEGLPGTIGAWLARKPVVMKIVGDYAWEIYRQQSPSNLELLDEFVQKSHAGFVGWLERIERRTTKRARHVITPSRYLKKIAEAWGTAPEKINVICNTIPPLPPTPVRDELRAMSGLAEKKIILTVVRAVPWKHGDFLCETLVRLPDEYRLVIVGDGPSLPDWKRRAEELDVSSRVIFTGKLGREKVAEWYAVADIFALPSGYEGFPHVVAEAASVGLPSLVSDKGGNPETKELFPQHVTVLPYLDTDAWVKALEIMPERLEPVFSELFEKKVDAYLALLEQAVKSN
ncbi:MAG: glycosyltransferase family 4 protein [Patescibacteria group bacterium]